MKKCGYTMALVLCLIISFSGYSNAANLVASMSPTNPRAYGEAELDRALELGIGVYRETDEAVTFAEFMRMLDRTIELADSTKLKEWHTRLPEARESVEIMTRADGMFAILCAAESLGEKYARKNVENSGILWERLGNWGGKTGQEYQPNDIIFPRSLQEGIPTILFNPQDDNENRRGDAITYSFGRMSYYSNRTLFDYEAAGNTMRVSDPFLYTEALLAALRLYDSGLDGERVLTDADRDILRLAEERKEAIINSPTLVEVTGKKYYVSNSGNDKNDGRSPETAWASIKKVNNAKLKPGDGVFFKRGDIWRNYSLFCQKGVTYSAYGEGDKPRFYGSPENGANPDFWSLVPGSNNVWVYHIEMNECGSIVFNDGEKVAEKYPAFWDMASEQYVISLDMQTPFSVHVLEHNWFFNETDLKGMKITREATDATSHFENGSALTFWGMDMKGKLYLRCDEGNPGAVYQSIEFSSDPHGSKDGSDILTPTENNVIDNLCLRYGGNMASFIQDGLTLQNCDISYIGGGAYAYMPLDKSPFEPESLRDLICFDGVALVAFDPSNVRIENNYIHDCFMKAFNFEHHLDNLIENISVSGNLFERNGQGGNIYNFFPSDEGDALRFKDLLFDDNYWMYTGFGWGEEGNHDPHAIMAFEYYRPNQFENIVFSNNVFYLSKGTMFVISGKPSLEPFVFSGNTYVQTNGGTILFSGETYFEWKLYYYDVNAEETIKQLTGDNAAIVLPPSW